MQKQKYKFKRQKSTKCNKASSIPLDGTAITPVHNATNTNTEIQIHKYKYINATSQIQIYRST